MPYKWLRGRYRFTAVFIEHLFVQDHCNYDIERALEDTKECILESLINALKSLRASNTRVLDIFKEAAVTVHLTGLPKCMAKREEADIIEYGLALLQQHDNNLVAKLYEPLVLEAAKRFFTTSEYEELHGQPFI